MDLDKQFDELARRKLDELNVPFEEGHWLAAQQAIKARSQGGRRRVGWWITGLVLLLGTAFTWWALQEDATPRTAQRIARVSPLEHRSTPAHAADRDARTAAPPRSGATAAQGTERANEGSAPVSRAVPVDPVGPAATPSLSPVLQASSSDAYEAAKGSAHRPASEGAVPNASSTAAITTIGMPAQGAPSQVPAQAITSPEDTHTSGLHPADAALPEGQLLTAVLDAPPAAPLAPQGSDADRTASDRPKGVDPRTAPTPASATVAGQTPQDTAAVPPPAPLQLPEATTASSAWELGLLGGILRSSSRYAGGNSDSWQDGLSPERTTWYGAEAMRMGRHFGWGSGLHYGAYAERLELPELQSTTQDIQRFWFLAQVDTAILVVADTLEIDGQTYFAGQTVPTTIDVLTQGFDTTTTTTLQRAARDRVNRVHYIEVPLLLDAHVVQGRWNLGVRGGPTVGLLAGRRGSLPNGTNDGYIDLGDEAFREVVFGWTARAYVRYRFNAGWSVGVEPMLRGQFGNALQQDDLSRRSSAIGGVVSLSYRLK